MTRDVRELQLLIQEAAPDLSDTHHPMEKRPATLLGILQGDLTEIKGIMTRSRELGMRTFDWALFELYNEGLISFDEAIRNADSANELRLNIKLKSERGEPATSAFMSLSIDQGPTPEEIEEQRHQELQKQQETRRRLEDEQLQQLREKKRLAEAASGRQR